MLLRDAVKGVQYWPHVSKFSIQPQSISSCWSTKNTSVWGLLIRTGKRGEDYTDTLSHRGARKLVSLGEL